MVKKFNLSEAAKEILSASVSSKQSGQDKPARLSTSVAYGQHDVGHIGDSPEEEHDELPDYTKGTPTATPPGATPPVGSEPMKKLSSQPGEHEGAEHDAVQEPATDYSSIRDRIKAKLAMQTMKPNPGAHFDSYGEDTEYDEEMVAEEENEKHEDEKQDKAMMKKMVKKSAMKEEEEHEDEKQDKAMMKKMVKKSALKEKMKEDMDALLSGENLSEEFVTKATTIFETAVLSRVAEIQEQLEEEIISEFEVVVDELKEDFGTKIDDYLNYVVENWMKQNELAIESGLRAEIVEDFITGLRDLFVENYIDVPEDKVDVVEEMASQVEELEAKLNEEIARSIEMKKELNEHKKFEAVHAVCEGLTQTQVEKMKALAENVEYTTEEEFADKLVTLRESYFPNGIVQANKSALEEGVEIEDEKATKIADPLMEVYAKTISKTLIK